MDAFECFCRMCPPEMLIKQFLAGLVFVVFGLLVGSVTTFWTGFPIQVFGFLFWVYIIFIVVKSVYVAEAMREED